jgi:large subunit ribosomal protein L33
MARKQNRIIVVLSSPGGDQLYTTVKNRRNSEGKLKLRKYNRRTRTHEVFTETKVKKGK